MPSAVRTRLTYANVVATLALVFAMSGGALAATHYLITSKKQISPKVLKELKGGAGAAGAMGAAGAAGAPGKEGAAGKDGASGNSGANGESVLVKGVSPGAECKEGGSEFKVGSGTATYACNGAKGKEGKEGASVVNTEIAPSPANPECKEGGSEFKVGSSTATYACNGKEGSPWTDKGVLPAEATETGTWSFSTNSTKAVGRKPRVSISFTIPLAGPLPAEACNVDAPTCHVHLIKEEEEPPAGGGCGGGTVEKPTAEPGNLCIYIKELEGADEEFLYENPANATSGAGTTGIVLGIPMKEGTGGEGRGTWAVTAEKAG